MLDKAIKSGKERRKPYYGSAKHDRTCRNHGSCPYCAKARKLKARKLALKAKENLAEVDNN